MRRPNNYDEAKVQGGYTPVELGGHKMVIKSVEERMTKTDRPTPWFISTLLREISRQDISWNLLKTQHPGQIRNGRIRNGLCCRRRC